MKNGWNKKIIIISGLVIFLFLTAFFPWNMPKLINADKPFIDLSGSIGESIGSANEAYEKAVLTPAPDDTVIPTVTPEPTDVPDISDPNDGELKIMIGDENYAGSGEAVFLKSEGSTVLRYSIVAVKDLKQAIINRVSDGLKVVLVDNYAETNSFKLVKRMLEEVNIEFRIESE